MSHIKTTNPKIGIRPVIDARRLGVREDLEEKTMKLANAAAEIISKNCFYPWGEPVECVIADTTISGSAEAAACAEKFSKENVVGTLSVSPCWCYGYETIDTDPMTVKAIWGYNGTERPGAVYLACAMAVHNQIGLPAFSIYGRDVQDLNDDVVPADVQEKIISFAKGAIAVGVMRGKSYVGIGAVSMGIAGSMLDADVLHKYLGIRAEWVDMSEVGRRLAMEIYDHEEYEKAYKWVRANCKEGIDINDALGLSHSREQKEIDWETSVKMTLICRDIVTGNPNLAKIGYEEEAIGRNGIAGGFQGQRMWTNWQVNADFTEAILNSTFDWNGARQPLTFATENDYLNGITMLMESLISYRAAAFADVRTFWSPDAIKRVTGWTPTGKAANGFIHLINSGAAALDASGEAKDENGNSVMKPWWEMKERDIKACLDATTFSPADLRYFRGGGFSSTFSTQTEMPVTMVRLNVVDKLGLTIQIAEGYTLELPEDVDKTLLNRTDKTWPSTWFAPIVTGEGAFKDVYSVMANWGANHGAFTYGHVGADLITLASMLRIPVTLHNVSEDRIFRPHTYSAFGTKDLESADYRFCESYGPLYK